MMLSLAPLILAFQVGQAPEIVLEPLPMPRKPQEQQAPSQKDTPQVAMLAISGNQAIINGDYERAASLLHSAREQALEEGDLPMAAETGLDESRALILGGKLDQATALLATLRNEAPGNAEVWIASSVAARRSGDLMLAQSFIVEAAGFAPQHAGLGLEAGTVAYLSGSDDAARKSWQSVIALAPESDEADVARQYIELLDAPDENVAE